MFSWTAVQRRLSAQLVLPAILIARLMPRASAASNFRPRARRGPGGARFSPVCAGRHQQLMAPREAKVQRLQGLQIPAAPGERLGARRPERPHRRWHRSGRYWVIGCASACGRCRVVRRRAACAERDAAAAEDVALFRGAFNADHIEGGQLHIGDTYSTSASVSMPKSAAASRNSCPAKMPSPKLAPQPAKPGNRAGFAPARRLLSVTWTRMDQQQARIDRRCSSSHSTGRLPDQATHSSTSLTCSAAWICTGASLGHGDDCRQFVRRYGPQAVRRDSDIGPGQGADGRSRGVKQLCELIDRADEPALAGMRCRSTKGAVCVKARQQREPDARRLGSQCNSRRHLPQDWRRANRRGHGGDNGIRRRGCNPAPASRHRAASRRLRVSSGDISSANRYIVSRHVQKVSAVLPRVSASPAMPRWKA